MNRIDADRMKCRYTKDDSTASVSEGTSKKSKFTKKRKAEKKEKRKHKRRRKHSTSSSSSESGGEVEWVEKVIEEQTSSNIAENAINVKMQKKPLIRDEWMNIEEFPPCISKYDMKKQKCNAKEENSKKTLLANPGQSDRELNPYWKDGGNGLPQNNSGRMNNSQMDANWLKKGLQRAEEQALRDGRSLEEVAAERWGSLETIRSMIAKAEKMSNIDRPYKTYHDRSSKDVRGSTSLRIRNRSRSRSNSRERFGKYSTSDYSSRHMRHKQTYQKPKDDDYQQTMHKSSYSRVKNWKKDKEHDNNGKLELSASLQSKETNAEVISNASKIDESMNIISLTEAEMNKLGAKIIKAELMGDNELAVQLKAQLERARKLAADNTNVQEETVILTRTDAKGVTRPIQPRDQYKQSMENHKKKRNVETHISGERVRHFADDDKYSLQEMFQREKGRSANEDEAVFSKLASKSVDDIDDIFEQQIARTDAEEKQYKRDRMHAIKEHKDLSKCMDNCWWCLDSKNMLKHMIVTMDSAICLSLPACTSLTTGHCILTPINHVACQLQLDEDVWERLTELKRKLIKMFMSENMYPVFFEVYKKYRKFAHMQLGCVPLPKELGESGPMYFKKALLECETEWSVNKKVIDLKHKDIRRAVPNGLSYFMVEFASHPGYAHVIEDERVFPNNFAEEIIGGMLDLDCNIWRKPKRQSFDEQRVKALEFTEMWRKFNS